MENQRRGRGARAELRKKRKRMGIRVGGAVVVIAVVVLVVTSCRGRFTGLPPQPRTHTSRSSPFLPPCRRRGCSHPPARPALRASPSQAGRSWPRSSTLPRGRRRRGAVPGGRADAGPRAHPPDGLRERQGAGDPLRHRDPGFQAVPRRRGRSWRPGAASTGCTYTPTTGSSTSSRPARPDLHARPAASTSGAAAQQHPGRAGHGKVTVFFFTSPGKKPGSTRATRGTCRSATTTRSNSTWARRSSRRFRSPTGAAVAPWRPISSLSGWAPGSKSRGMLVATGRRNHLVGLGVGALGLDEGGRAIPVDGRMRVHPGCGRSATSPGRVPSPMSP